MAILGGRSSTAVRSLACGFTLVEMIGVLFLSGMIMVVLSSSLMTILRGNFSVANYADMSLQGRRTISAFSEDVRSASDLMSLDSSRFQIRIPQTGGWSSQVDYQFDARNGILYRYEGGIRTRLMNGIEDLFFSYYDSSNGETSKLLEAKKIQLRVTLGRGNSMATNHSHVVSARVAMRNKAFGN